VSYQFQVLYVSGPYTAVQLVVPVTDIQGITVRTVTKSVVVQGSANHTRGAYRGITSKTAKNQNGYDENGHKSDQNGHSESPKRPHTNTAQTKTATSSEVKMYPVSERQ